MRRRWMATVSVLALMGAACGDDATTSAGDGGPTVVVSTNILGDAVDAFAGDQVEVVTIMPVGADPHDFQASAQDADAMRTADALITNGAGFEEGLLDVIDGATDDGTPTYEAISGVGTIEFDGEHGHAEGETDEHETDEHAEGEHEGETDEHAEGETDEHADDEHAEGETDEHADDEHADDEHVDDEHEGEDPHFFTDPARMAEAVTGIADFLVETVDGVDAAALEASAEEYVAELEALDAELEQLLADVPTDRRVLITNHEVFGYFADRYDFEIAGAVIPGLSTTSGASAGELADLADLIADEGVPAIFADTTSSDELVDSLASEVGDIEVVELFTESLGEEDSEGATYLDMMRTNGERIRAALGA